MNCKYCGSPLDADSKFCTTCGAKVEEQVEKTVMVNRPTQQTPPVQQAPVQQPYGQPPVQPNPYLQQPYTPPVAPQYNQPMMSVPTQQPGESMAKAAQILGIISLFCMGGIVAILSIIFGCVAKSQGYQGGKATTGIVCGIISLLMGIAVYVIYFIVLGATMGM